MSDRDRDEPGAPPPSDADEEARKAAEARAKAEAAARAKAEAEAAEAAKPAWEKMPVEPEIEDAASDPLVRALGRSCGEGAVRGASRRAGDLAIEVAAGSLREVASSLKLDHGFTLLVDLCGVHYPQREEAPYEVVLHLYDMQKNRRVRLKTALAEGESPPSVTPVWAGANWLEREAYDMYGIRFEDHPDMTRILMWEGFNGHPLRKDFPVEGIDTGSAIYPEYYAEEMGPVTGTGTGWRPAPPPEPEPEPAAESDEEGA
ncbi:MAG: NADH-quinone oxidoreductase subunit C [Thermoanaerobaculia bacterium]|nr:NADH-quinone oxidoreductase subunit C [Thermoanaerobaculia bacterium]